MRRLRGPVISDGRHWPWWGHGSEEDGRELFGVASAGRLVFGIVVGGIGVNDGPVVFFWADAGGAALGLEWG